MGLFSKKNKDSAQTSNGGDLLKIAVSNTGAEYTFTVEGRLDTNTSPELEARINQVVGSAEKLIAFCRGIQAGSPIDSYAAPEPYAMPGYSDEVIMAAGTFTQGSSLELSCDGPMREPYIIYFQGGITYEHSKFGVIMSLHSLKQKGLI